MSKTPTSPPIMMSVMLGQEEECFSIIIVTFNNQVRKRVNDGLATTVASLSYAQALSRLSCALCCLGDGVLAQRENEKAERGF